MPGRRMVRPSVWQRLRPLLRSRGGEDAVLLFLHLHTSEQSNLLGLYRWPVSYGEADMGWSRGRIRRALKALETQGEVLFDPTAEVVWFPEILTAQPLQNPQQVRGAIMAVQGLPYTPLLGSLYDALRDGLHERPYLQPLLQLLGERLGQQSSEQSPRQFAVPYPYHTNTIPEPARPPDHPDDSEHPQTGGPSDEQRRANIRRLRDMAAAVARARAIPS